MEADTESADFIAVELQVRVSNLHQTAPESGSKTQILSNVNNIDSHLHNLYTTMRATAQPKPGAVISDYSLAQPYYSLCCRFISRSNPHPANYSR